VLVLQGEEPELGDVSPTALEAWQEATARIDAIEERRQIPYLLVAIPTEVRARELKMTLAELDAALLPALSASAAELAAEVDALRAAVGNARTLTIQSGVGHRLTLDISGRHWLRDVGTLQLAGVPEGVQPVHNLPAGSLYTTVVESATTGSSRIPELASARDVVLRFVDGRIVAIEADQGGEQLTAMFDRHSGEPRRVSHLGIGVNRHVASPVGWPLVDEHRRGTLFLAFGENRYLGGANTSSLNLDVVIPNAKLLADDCIIATEGNLSLTPDD
jgi:leucyl aminopeptidase (aminopeptidase T)